MAVAYAPFDADGAAPPPRARASQIQMPISDNTECNYIVLGFVAGVFLLGLADSMRK
jgi:hypothetical protein